ncbi:putative modulator for HflB protease specific for phage lambda cII repressor [Magnetospirillum sp. LM-5]|uniref:FtsH protease activity modulator HflK n=1 Tax=Magnetospirillum sp. LM-5 TaxID=2681466 RepID=UPI0013833032|nr:FtsH protease activity modulator HflK [Magnetospirillum sp. LM-5]CAA7616619.1 putative modulator for HflB protease specific for phage lambda cII repressor [Magnetospirillum sp. LM-5]
MPWNQGGGPWGGGGNNGGGNGGGGGPWGRGPGGGRPGPDFEEMIRKGQERLKKAVPPGRFSGGTGLMVVAALGVAAWLATGIYRVNPDEQGVVLRFGKWVDTTEPGLRYHLPYPIETVMLPKVTKINQLQLGFRSAVDTRFEQRQGATRDVPEESRMLTGDENIVEADFTVFWQIKDAGKFLFNVRDAEGTVKVAAESSMRDVIGRSPIQAALSDKRQPIADAAKIELQRLLDSYDAGILVTQVQLQKVEPPAAVIDAFNDVQRARADQERARNEAEAYRNDIIPRARGEVEKLVQEAEAYKEQVVNQAEGEVKRFLALYNAWKQASDVTERRLYLETMEEIMKGAPKVIIDPSAKGAQGVVPYMALPELKKSQAGAGGAR